MADKVYVEVGKFTVGDIFDNQFKSMLPAVMEKAADAAVGKSSALTGSKPKDGKGFKVSGTLTMTLDKKAKKLSATCKLIIAALPKEEMKAMPNGSGGLPVDPEKVDKGDVKALAEAVVTDAIVKQANPFMAKGTG